MPINTVNPTANITPNIGGDIAEAGITNTGHSNTSVIASISVAEGESDTQTEDSSGIWHTFSVVPGGLISLRLKFTWSVLGTVSCIRNVAGSGSASITYNIEYTIDGSSNWINAVSKSRVVSTNQNGSLNSSGSFSVDLSINQDVSLVQVRDRLTSFATGGAGLSPGSNVNSDANLTTSISLIRLEAETPGGLVGYKFVLGS